MQQGEKEFGLSQLHFCEGNHQGTRYIARRPNRWERRFLQRGLYRQNSKILLESQPVENTVVSELGLGLHRAIAAGTGASRAWVRERAGISQGRLRGVRAELNAAPNCRSRAFKAAREALVLDVGTKGEMNVAASSEISSSICLAEQCRIAALVTAKPRPVS